VSLASKKRGDLFALIALACGGLVLLAVISSPYWHDVALGHTDFLAFYAGGRLAFTPGLYDPQQAMAEQLRAAHVMGEGTYFIRLPWFAAAMWPLARLPYIPAQFVWQFLLICGLIAFVILWPRPSLAIRATILCYSLPALMNLRMGQDVPLLLACMAGSLALLHREKPLLAGLLLSLTLAKFHLFLPLFPAVLFARRWRFATGLFGGAGCLLAASFLVSGPDWPRLFLAAISDPATTPRVIVTPSFYYLMHGSPLGIGAVGIALVILYLRRARTDIEFLIAAAPVVILPLLPHAGAYDCLLLTPLAMTALDRGTRKAKIAAALLLIPVTYFVAWSVNACSMLIPILDVAMLALYAMASPNRIDRVVADRRVGSEDRNLLDLALDN
jgi:Glycosyltransferase family 87